MGMKRFVETATLQQGQRARIQEECWKETALRYGEEGEGMSDNVSDDKSSKDSVATVRPSFQAQTPPARSRSESRMCRRLHLVDFQASRVSPKL